MGEEVLLLGFQIAFLVDLGPIVHLLRVVLLCALVDFEMITKVCVELDFAPDPFQIMVPRNLVDGQF